VDLKPEGSLAERDFPGLIQDLSERRWTGVLTLSAAGVGKRVLVQDGRLVFATSSSPDDRLGELLLRRGRLTLRQLVDAGAAVAPGKRLGTILVEQGVLDPRDLVRTVVEHTQEIIYGAFLWTEGRYRLKEGLDAEEAITLKISTPDIIVEGIRRIESWTRIDRAVGGLDALYGRVGQWEEIARGMTLTPEQLDILKLLDRQLEVETICGASPLPDFQVCQTVWAYRVIGLLHRVDPPTVAGAIDDEGLDLVLSQD
jgi:hypothetical protein